MLSDSGDAILNSFQKIFPQATIGNFFFHHQEINNQSKAAGPLRPQKQAFPLVKIENIKLKEKKKFQKELVLGGFRWLADLKLM